MVNGDKRRGQRLPRRLHGEQNEAIHFLLFFRWRGAIGIETAFGVLRQRWHYAADAGGQISAHRFR
jgi:hypothetical protein